MKNYLYVFILSFPLISYSQNSFQTAKNFQDQLNKYYADSSTSPLTEIDRSDFVELPFFEIDTTFVFTAKIERLLNEEAFEMKTSTDRLPLYRPYYKATFIIDTQVVTLLIYQNERLKAEQGYEDYLFLPFTDITNGDSTYGGGRYIDLKITKADSIVIDFNQAYNPYCAYNKKYSCPIPPAENDINYAIKAGVQYLPKPTN